MELKKLVDQILGGGVHACCTPPLSATAFT